MKQPRLRDMTVEQLLVRYHRIVSEEVRPFEKGRSRRFAARMTPVEKELCARRPDEWLEVLSAEDRADAKWRDGAIARVRWAYLGRRFGLPEPPPKQDPELAALATEHLVGRFIALAIEEDEAEGGIEEVERIYWRLDAVITELRWREGDQRRALLPLYTHAHAAVRAKAAEATRELAPELSRSRLLAVDDQDWSPTVHEAGAPIGEIRRKQKLHGMEVGQLVERFLTLALEQGEAIDLDQIPKVNRLFWQIEAVGAELEARAGDQRRALVPLLTHRDANVRFKAAMATRAVASDAARAAFELIVERHEYPQAADARAELR